MTGRPRPARGRFPFRDHRTVAEIERAAVVVDRTTRRWCDQCDARVTGADAAECRSPWCRLRPRDG